MECTILLQEDSRVNPKILGHSVPEDELLFCHCS